MQRKSTRKFTTTLSSCPEEERQENKCEENTIDPIKEYAKDMNITNILAILKYLLILILLLPWIITFSSKVKENDYLPKLQKLIEDSFTCPIVVRNFSNCTCDVTTTVNNANQGL